MTVTRSVSAMSPERAVHDHRVPWHRYGHWRYGSPPVGRRRQRLPVRSGRTQSPSQLGPWRRRTTSSPGGRDARSFYRFVGFVRLSDTATPILRPNLWQQRVQAGSTVPVKFRLARETQFARLCRRRRVVQGRRDQGTDHDSTYTDPDDARLRSFVIQTISSGSSTRHEGARQEQDVRLLGAKLDDGTTSHLHFGLR